MLETSILFNSTFGLFVFSVGWMDVVEVLSLSKTLDSLLRCEASILGEAGLIVILESVETVDCVAEVETEDVDATLSYVGKLFKSIGKTFPSAKH